VLAATPCDNPKAVVLKWSGIDIIDKRPFMVASLDGSDSKKLATEADCNKRCQDKPKCFVYEFTVDDEYDPNPPCLSTLIHAGHVYMCFEELACD
jgi:hypothetical protein